MRVNAYFRARSRVCGCGCTGAAVSLGICSRDTTEGDNKNVASRVPVLYWSLFWSPQWKRPTCVSTWIKILYICDLSAINKTLFSDCHFYSMIIVFFCFSFSPPKIRST